MTMYEALRNEPRLLLEAKLRPLQGHRFQPTGFAELGAATYTVPDGPDMLIVESAQSVANRMEAVCWDFARKDVVTELAGLPYVRVVRADGSFLTSSILEAHRLHSPYIINDDAFFDGLKREFMEFAEGPIDLRRVATSIFRIDPNSLLHGVFFANKELAGGRIRLQRLISGFIEASDVRMAESGGAKNDRVNPAGDTKAGYGNVIYHRVEFVAADIRAYFNLDLAGLRSYGLGTEREDMLITLALWKIRRFLETGLRLRTACDLEVVTDLQVTRPRGFGVPSTAELAAALQAALDAETGFADPRVTEVVWRPSRRSRADAGSRADGSDGTDEGGD